MSNRFAQSSLLPLQAGPLSPISFVSQLAVHDSDANEDLRLEAGSLVRPP